MKNKIIPYGLVDLKAQFLLIVLPTVMYANEACPFKRLGTF